MKKKSFLENLKEIKLNIFEVKKFKNESKEYL